MADSEKDSALKSFAEQWNNAVGGDEDARALAIAAAIDLAALRIVDALENLSYTLERSLDNLRG